MKYNSTIIYHLIGKVKTSSKISTNYKEKGSCLIQTWLTGWSKRHTKDQNCCINVAGKVTTPSLCCTILILESTVERRQTYKLLLYYVCRPEWGTVSQDMALTEQKSDMVVIYEPAKPTRILLVELTVRWDTANNFVKKDRKVWKIDGRFDPCWLWCTQPSSRDRMWGSEDAANLEYICNQVWIFCIDDTG